MSHLGQGEDPVQGHTLIQWQKSASFLLCERASTLNFDFHILLALTIYIEQQKSYCDWQVQNSQIRLQKPKTLLKCEKDVDFCHCIQCSKHSQTHFRNSKIVLIKILFIQKTIIICDISTIRSICRCEKSSHFLMLSTKKSHYVHPQQFQKSLF